MPEFEIIERKPAAEELFMLRESVGRGIGEKEAFEKGLKNSLYGVCAFEAQELIGTARVIGDGHTCFYIQDVIVKPEYQNMGIGSEMMKKLMEYIETNACSGYLSKYGGDRIMQMRRKDREVANKEEIKGIIEKCKVCHLAMVDKELPYVVPLNFGYILDDSSLTLFFHSAKAGRKIDILKENNAVCFEMESEGKLGHVENPCNSGYYFESVHGFGHVEFIEDINEKCNALTLLMKHQSKQDFVFTEKQANSVCIYKVVSTDFTGKKKPNPNGHIEGLS